MTQLSSYFAGVSTLVTNSPLVQQTYGPGQSCLTSQNIQISDQDEPTDWLHQNDSYVPRSRINYGLHPVTPIVSSIDDRLQRKRERYISMDDLKKEHLLQHIRDCKKVRLEKKKENHQTPNSTNMSTTVDTDPSPQLTVDIEYDTPLFEPAHHDTDDEGA